MILSQQFVTIVNLKQRAKRWRKNWNISNFRFFHSVWKKTIWNISNFRVWKKTIWNISNFQIWLIQEFSKIWNKYKFETSSEARKKKIETFQIFIYFHIIWKKTIWNILKCFKFPNSLHSTIWNKNNLKLADFGI